MHVPDLIRTAAAAALVFTTSMSQAVPLCRWVDEQGRTHISDVVPPAYKKSATCTDSAQYDLSPQQRREAEQRSAAQRARKAPEAGPPSAPPASAPPAADSAASQPAGKRPAESVTDQTDCDTWWRLFDESAECFDPYRTMRGGLKPEAFDHCNVIPSPETKCGPRVF